MCIHYLLITGCESPLLHGNGYCDDINNKKACLYDGGDCCGGIIHPIFCTVCQCLEGDCNQGEDCCLIVRISLTNELLNAGYENLNGDYEISMMPNGQRSWISGGYAIWYNSGYWIIGNLAHIGQLMGFMWAINDPYGLIDDENEWHYEDGGSWISPTDQSDIQITCVNE